MGEGLVESANCKLQVFHCLTHHSDQECCHRKWSLRGPRTGFEACRTISEWLFFYVFCIFLHICTWPPLEELLLQQPPTGQAMLAARHRAGFMWRGLGFDNLPCCGVQAEVG